jgi:hypothetical protein
MLPIPQESEANQFKGIQTGDESWFQYSFPSSKMFARSPVEVIPRTPQAIGAKETVITSFFTAKKPIVLEVLAKCRKCNRQRFVPYIFPDLKKGNMSFHDQKRMNFNRK